MSLALFFVTAICLTDQPVSAASITTSSFVKSDTTIDANDKLDAYTGTGGLLLPQSFSGPSVVRRGVADCLDCIWKYTLYCAQDASVACAHAVTTCAPGLVRYRVKFGHVHKSLDTIGSVCWSSTRPATRELLSYQLRESAIRKVPVLQPDFAPHGPSLVGLPVMVWSGQPTVFRPAPMNVLGFSIRVTAKPVWQWDWGDTTHEWTSNPGSVGVHSRVSHRYRIADQYLVSVHTRWSATYAIEGVGSYQLNDATINQDASFLIHVANARTVLIRAGNS